MCLLQFVQGEHGVFITVCTVGTCLLPFVQWEHDVFITVCAVGTCLLQFVQWEHVYYSLYSGNMMFITVCTVGTCLLQFVQWEHDVYYSLYSRPGQQRQISTAGDGVMSEFLRNQMMLVSLSS